MSRGCHRRDLVDLVIAEFRRYKALGDAALAQLEDSELRRRRSEERQFRRNPRLAHRRKSPIAVHGFPDDRRREAVAPTATRSSSRATVTRGELLDEMERRVGCAASARSTTLTDEHLQQTVTIRGQSFAVHDALHRSLAHICYHVGQLVFLAKSFRGEAWKNLSIPLGQSEGVQHRTRVHQDPAAHAAAISPPEARSRKTLSARSQLDLDTANRA